MGARRLYNTAAQTISDRMCRYLPKSDVVLKLGVNSQKKLSTAARFWALLLATAFSRNRAGCTVITWASPRVSSNRGDKKVTFKEANARLIAGEARDKKNK